MQLFCALFVLIVKIAHLIVAVEPEGRMCSGCTVLSKTLYCYSGGTWAASVNYEAKGYADFYMLDISHNFVRSGALTGWLNLSNADNYILEPNWDFSIVNVKGQAFVTNGGIGYGIPSAYIKAKPLVNVTTKFLGEEWSTIPLSNPSDQYWGESGNYVESKNSIYYWGGWKYGSQQKSAAIDFLLFDSFHTDTKAATSFRILDYATNMWSVSPAHTLPNNSIVRYQHTATMAGDNNIYFIGGSDGYKNNYNISMNEILVYDTIADTWDVRKTQGSVTPGPRILHTTTWIPGTSTLLVYGGGVVSAALKNTSTVNDYCYKYDTVKNQWTRQDIRGAPGAGERYGHSAVLVGNSTLFILFGIGPNPFDNGQSVFFILDLNTMAWTDYYDASALNYSPPLSGTNNSHDPSIPPQPKSNNTPAIVGAVVGCVGAVLLGALFGGCYFWRRRKAQRTDQSVEPNVDNHAFIENLKDYSTTSSYPPVYDLRPQSKLYIPDTAESKVYIPAEPQRTIYLTGDHSSIIFQQRHSSNPTLDSGSIRAQTPIPAQSPIRSQSPASEKPDSREGYYDLRLQPVKPDAIVTPEKS